MQYTLDNPLEIYNYAMIFLNNSFNLHQITFILTAADKAQKDCYMCGQLMSIITWMFKKPKYIFKTNKTKKKVLIFLFHVHTSS